MSFSIHEFQRNMSHDGLRGSGQASYGAVRVYRDDPDYGRFSELADQVTSKLLSINSSVTSLERAIKVIGTARDSKDHRNKIHSTEQDTNKLVAETTKLLKQLLKTRANMQEKLLFSRLKSDFEESITRYSDLQKRIAEKVKASPALFTSSHTPDSKSQSSTTGWLDEEQAWHDREQLIKQDEERRAELQVQGQIVDDDLALIQEREERIRQLESDILDVNEIFRDLGAMVMEQGEMIDNIEDNVSKAHDNVEAGNVQLQKASDYQRKSRKKMCCIVAILLVVGGIITLIIVLSVKK